MEGRLFQSLQWRCIGPHRGGRVVAVAGHPTEVGTFYFGGAAGGVWKTTSGGAQWENVSDGYLHTSAVGAITVAPSSPNVVYVGTGEATIRGNVSHGDGVYKSTDGGHSWQHLGLDDTKHIGDILVHPHDPNTVYVAGLGHAWGPNTERGVFRTRDGGVTWQKVLYVNDHAGCSDLTMDPHQPETLYASIWDGHRTPHSLESGGPASGLWKSTDGGETWTEITNAPGLPTGLKGKIGVAASPAQPGRVWAIIEAAKPGTESKGTSTEPETEDDGGIFRSDDWGATWERVNGERDLRQRPWYYMHIYADPQDAETVWVLNMNCWKSSDGGRTFTSVPTPHGDNHGLWIDPQNSQRLIESNDGGAIVSFDGGRTWSSILNQPTAQFYHVTADDETPYNLYGSQQDNWAMRLPSSDPEGAITWKNYAEPGGGESGYIAVSRKEPHVVYGGAIGTGLGHGRLIAWNPQTGHKRNVTVWPEELNSDVRGSAARDLKYRFQWTFPIEVSVHNPDVLYTCSNFVHRSYDGGVSWEVISPDLTRNDPSRQGLSGGPITADNSGAEIYCTIFAFRESPLEQGVFWAGSDDGLVHLSRDGGKSWQNVTPPSLPEWAMISIIEPSPFDAATVYVAATRYKLDDTAAYIFKSTDYGATWTRITAGIPETEFTRVVRADPNREGLLYAGTETGVYISFDDGAQWQRFESNLPIVPIYDLAIKGTDLLAATHGRAFWILDDLTPLYQMHEQHASEKATLYAPRPTARVRYYAHLGENTTEGYTHYLMTGPVTVAFRPVKEADGTVGRAFLDAGKNPPNGVILHYALAEKPEEPITLEIVDSAGKTVRTFSSREEETPRLPAQPGANRFVWNLRYTPPTAIEKEGKPEDADARRQRETLAARALPGTYELRLKVGATTQTQSLTILPDPRLSVTEGELREQFELKREISARIDEVHQMVNSLRRVRKQVADWRERTKDEGRWSQLRERAEALDTKLKAIEATLVNVEDEKLHPTPAKLEVRLTALSAMIDESDDAPTRAAHEVYDLLAGRVTEQQGALQRVLNEDVAGFNQQARESEVPLLLA